MSDHKFPYLIHGTDASGLTVVTRAPNAITASGVTLYVGDELEITEEIYALSKDRNGDSFLDRESTAFGIGPAPQHLKDAVAAAHKAQLLEEKNTLLQRNPALAKSTAAGLRLAAIEAELEG